MKFGKRLASEASRRWRPFYLDYKTVKRAIQHDVRARGLTPTARNPQDVLGMQQLLNAVMLTCRPFWTPICCSNTARAGEDQCFLQ